MCVCVLLLQGCEGAPVGRGGIGGSDATATGGETNGAQGGEAGNGPVDEAGAAGDGGEGGESIPVQPPTIPQATPAFVLEFGDASAGGGIDVLEVDGDDNVVLGGHFTGEIDFGEGVRRSEYTDLGAGSLFVIKVSKEGQLVWSNVFPVVTCCNIGDMSIDTNGDVIIGGSARGDSDFGDGKPLTDPSYRGHVTKLRGSDGRLVFSRRYGSGQGDNLPALTTDADDNIYTAGAFAAPFTFTPEEQSVTEDRSLFVARFDSGGTLDWVKTFEKTDISSYFARLTFLEPERLVAIGNLYGPVMFGERLLAPLGTRGSGILVEFARDNTLLEATEVIDGGSLSDVRQVDSSLYVAGNVHTATAVGGLSLEHWAETYSPFVAELNTTTGHASWAETFEGELADVKNVRVMAVRLDGHGMLQTVITATEQDLTDRAWFVTMSPTGEVLRTRRLGDYVREIDVDSSAAVWVAGELRESFDFGEGQRRGPIFIAKYEPEPFE